MKIYLYLLVIYIFACKHQVGCNQQRENFLLISADSTVKKTFVSNDSMSIRVHAIYLDYHLHTTSFLLYCSVKDQEMFLCSYSTIVDTYIVSTAKKGIGNKTGSERTPLGLHEITNVICKDCPVGTIIRNKKNTGQTAKIFTDSTDNAEDFVLTRAIILNGMEEGKNKGGDVDSYTRGILIHGTNEEGLLGKLSSHGCIRLKNADVIELANEIPKGKFYLFISEN